MTAATSINPESVVAIGARVPTSWSCDKLDDLPFLTVTTHINHGAAENWMLYNLQVLPVATSIKHGAEQNTMLYKCSLSPRASTMELRTNI
jgi:hypothetical protein